MNFSKSFTVVVNKDFFNKFLFNKDHFFGSKKLSSFYKDYFSNDNIESIVFQLKQFPHKYLSVDLGSLYKTELITKVSITGQLKINNTSSVLVDTFWIYKYTSEKFELLTLSIIR